eukprot:1232294-Rhodomonas_salina.1
MSRHPPTPATDRHAMCVSEVHRDATHPESNTLTVAVYESDPKFLPCTDTLLFPTLNTLVLDREPNPLPETRMLYVPTIGRLRALIRGVTTRTAPEATFTRSNAPDPPVAVTVGGSEEV